MKLGLDVLIDIHEGESKPVVHLLTSHKLAKMAYLVRIDNQLPTQTTESATVGEAEELIDAYVAQRETLNTRSYLEQHTLPGYGLIKFDALDRVETWLKELAWDNCDQAELARDVWDMLERELNFIKLYNGEYIQRMKTDE